MPTAYISPDADSVDGGWTNETGGTSLFASIDEHLTPSDSDFIQSGNNPAADICKIRLSNPAAGTISGPFNVSYRYGKSGSATIDLKVRLKQGTTTIHEWTHAGVSATPATVTQTLSAPELASISDFTDLFLEFEANVPSSYVGPGDVVASATAWWGLRAYTAAGIGSNAIRLRRDGSSAGEQDFPTIAGGGLNLTDIANFLAVGGATGLWVVTLYDQTGGGLDVTEATGGVQPEFKLANLGSLPTIDFGVGSTRRLRSANLGGSTAQPITFTGVVIWDAGSPGVGCWEGQNSSQLIGHTGTINQQRIYGGSDLNATVSDGAWHAEVCVYNGASSNFAIDGTSNTGNPGTGALTAGTQIGIGIDSAFNTQWIGRGAEFGLWAIAFSGAQITSMNTNQHTYWGF